MKMKKTIATLLVGTGLCLGTVVSAPPAAHAAQAHKAKTTTWSCKKGTTHKTAKSQKAANSLKAKGYKCTKK